MRRPSPRIDPLEPRRLLAAGFQVELAFEASVTSEVRALLQTAANRWQQIITGDVPDADAGGWGAAVDDIRLTVRVKSIDGVGKGVAQTRPTYIRTGSNIPIAAEMEIDVDDVAPQTAAGVMDDLVTHEMAHAFGYGTTWKQFPGLVSGTGGATPLYLGANALREYRTLIGNASAPGVPLETTGGTGTRDTHWSEAVFNNELLTGFINGGANVISRVSAGAMADLGYSVNYAAADYFSLGVVTPPTPLPATLSGRAFVDADRDGTLDSGEAGAGGRTIYLDTNYNASLDSGEPSTTTDSNGNFTLTNITAGSYAVRQVLPDGQFQTSPAGGNPNWVTLTAGQAASGYLFGSNSPAPIENPTPTTGTIAGKLFDDLNADGKQDPGEGNLKGRTVYIDQDNDGTRDDAEPSATTNKNGNYSLYNVAAGAITLRQALPSGWEQTSPGSNAARSLNLTAGASITNAHFGSRQPRTATLGGKLWNDTDRDGRQDKGEADLKGITLWLDLDDDAKRDKNEPTAITDAKGQYRFKNLAAGDYAIRVSLPTGWSQTTPKKNRPQRVNVDTGDSTTNLHFGLKK